MPALNFESVGAEAPPVDVAEAGDGPRGRWRVAGAALLFVIGFSVVFAAGLYGLYLGAHMYLWKVWQNRGRSKGALEPTSRFGRPVIRKA